MTTFTDPAEAGKLICGPACFYPRTSQQPLPPVIEEDDTYAPDGPPW